MLIDISVKTMLQLLLRQTSVAMCTVCDDRCKWRVLERCALRSPELVQSL